MTACGSFRMVFFLEPTVWELKNSKCFFMALFEFIKKKKITSFRPVSVSPQFALLSKNWRMWHFRKNLIKSVHKRKLKDKILRPDPFWNCGNIQEVTICSQPSACRAEAPLSGRKGPERLVKWGWGGDHNSFSYFNAISTCKYVQGVSGALIFWALGNQIWGPILFNS